MLTEEDFIQLHGQEIVVAEDNTSFHEGYNGYEDDDGYYHMGMEDMTLGDITHEVSGNLKEMVLKRVGIDTSFGTEDHTITIIESHRNGGYCETCSFEYIQFDIYVDGEDVYSSTYDYNPFAVLQDWLTEED